MAARAQSRTRPSGHRHFEPQLRGTPRLVRLRQPYRRLVLPSGAVHFQGGVGAAGAEVGWLCGCQLAGLCQRGGLWFSVCLGG